jgi:PKD repeat protein
MVPPRARLEHNAEQDPQLLGEGDVRVLLAEAALPPQADFSYRPSSPFAGGTVTFTDQSTGGRVLSTWSWDFGDGGASAEPDPRHVFADAGDYSVRLLVTAEDGAKNSITETVAVGAPGRVLRVDASGGTVVVSLGPDNGIAVGDRFRVQAADASPELEIVELLEPQTSVARVVAGTPPEPGALLSPLPK